MESKESILIDFKEQEKLLILLIEKVKRLKIEKNISNLLVFCISFLKWRIFSCSKCQCKFWENISFNILDFLIESDLLTDIFPLKWTGKMLLAEIYFKPMDLKQML